MGKVNEGGPIEGTCVKTKFTTRDLRINTYLLLLTDVPRQIYWLY
jgi:hypothetical protein